MLRILYRCLLRFYPSHVRRELGPEMEEVFVHCVGVERGRRRWLAGPAALGRGVADTLAFAVTSRWDPPQGGRARSDGDFRTGRRRSFMFRRHEITGAVRQMRQRPFAAAAIVLMLGLGIGASTAMFSVVYGVLLKPLPFPDPDRLVQVYGARPDRGWTQVSLTEANFWDLRDLNHTFEEFGAWHGGSAILAGDAPEQVSVGVVSSGFFRALGVQPVVGRLFGPEEDAGGDKARPVLLSHAIWMRRYGGDRGIVGRSIMFGSGPRTVMGVLPAGTPWLDYGEVFVPFVRRADANRGSFEYAAVGRLKPGVPVETALADLQGVSKDLERRYPATNTGLGAALSPARTWVASDDLRRTLWILLGAVGLLLAIACVNVANLLLARASTRAREIAVRAALGASRFDLVRQSLAESLLLGVVACGAGLLVAAGILAVIRSVNPGGIPRIDQVAINGWVFAFASVVAVVVGVVTGLVPALQAPRTDLVRSLRQGQRGAVGDRRQAFIRHLFVGAEVALSMMLLVGAGLLARSLTEVLRVDRGFQTGQRLFAGVTIPAAYGEARVVQTAKDVLARVRAMPEVLSAAAVSGRLLSRGSTGLGLASPEQPDAPGATVPWGTWRDVSTDYFKTIGLPLVLGRDFTEADEIGKPWRTVISQRVADLFWPGQNPIGRTIILWKGQGDTRAEVIGVAANMRERGLEADPTLAVYFPSGEMSSDLQLILHTRGTPAAAIAPLRGAISGVDRALPISNIQSLDEAVDRSVATRRFTMLLLVAFAALALVLALAGVYGVLAYAVARRTAEIGVRLALGAGPRRVLRLVVAQGMRPVLAGIVVGGAASYWLSQLMTSLLFGVTARDPWTYASVIAALAATGVLACYLPARQVLRVDPVVALRIE
jgi:predicted permease